MQARSTNGSVNIQKVYGSVAVSTTNGSISIGEALFHSGQNELRSTNGSIRVGCLNKEFKFSLDTSNGRVTPPMNATILKQSPKSVA